MGIAVLCYSEKEKEERIGKGKKEMGKEGERKSEGERTNTKEAEKT